MARSIIRAGSGGLSMSIEGMDELAGIPGEYRKAAAREYRGAITAALKAAQYLVVRNLSEYADTTHAMQSVKVVPPPPSAVLTLTGSLVVEGPAEDYMDTIEFGRQAGATTPPTGTLGAGNTLAGWISRHPGFTGTPFVLARAIHERGIIARSPWQKAFDELDQSGAVDRAFDQALDRLIEQL